MDEITIAKPDGELQVVEVSFLLGELVESHSKVWCTACGRSEVVDTRRCLRQGWPMCCGTTMTVDSPDERAGAHYQLEPATADGWLLNLYPGNGRVYGDRKRPRAPFLRLTTPWKLLDAVRAASGEKSRLAR